VFIIGRPDSIFYFVYSKDLHMVALDPDNAYISPTVMNRTIQVIGRNFVSLDHLITCKLFFDPPIVVIGRYISNFTLECDLPPPPVTPSPG